MKKRGILGHALSEVIASMGHTDLLVIADAGFPTPPGVPRIDLAVRCGLPSMLEVTRAIADDLEVETVTIADELLTRDAALPAALRDRMFDFNVAVIGGMAADGAQAPVPARTPRELLAIAMA